MPLPPLVRRPGLVVFTVSTLVVAVGGAIAVFTLVHAVLMRALPVQEPERLVWMWNARVERDRAPFSLPDLEDYRAQNRTLAGLAPFVNWTANLTGIGEAERLEGVRVDPGFFDLLGVAAAHGRLIRTGDDPVERVVVVTDRLWKRRFGGDPSIVGRTIELSGVHYTVLGVLPPAFVFPFRDAELAVPLPLASDPRRALRGAGFLRVVARLKPGIDVAAAKRDLDAIARRLQAQYPVDDAKKVGVNLFGLQDEIVGNARGLLQTLLAAVLLLLVVAAANIVNLLVVSLSDRQPELQIRRALGASRARLVRQLAGEAAVLIVVGCTAAIAASGTLTRVLVWWAGSSLPRLDTAVRTPTVWSFAIATAVVLTVCAGIAPAVAATSHLDGAPADGRTVGSIDRQRLRRTFIALQVALALVLLAAIGLTLKGYVNLERVDPGFNPAGILSIQLSLPPQRYATPAAINQFAEALRPKLESVPGVKSAALISLLPLSGFLRTEDFRISGRPEPPPDAVPQAHYRVVTPGYFATAGVPLITGRDFSDDDRGTTAPVAIISRSFAQQFWPDTSPVGAHVRVGDPASPMLTIVGVVADVKQFALEGAPTSDVYVPLAQMMRSEAPLLAARMYWVVSSAADPAAIVEPVRSEIHAVDADIAVSGARTMTAVLADAVAGRRFNASVLGLFAQLALVLASAGVYALSRQSVVARTREIGVRMALGAHRADVVTLIARSSAGPIAAGVAVGFALAVAAGRVLAAQLFEVDPVDPPTFIAVCAIVVAAAAVATLAPALRATRIDPLVALKRD